MCAHDIHSILGEIQQELQHINGRVKNLVRVVWCCALILVVGTLVIVGWISQTRESVNHSRLQLQRTLEQITLVEARVEKARENLMLIERQQRLIWVELDLIKRVIRLTESERRR